MLRLCEQSSSTQLGKDGRRRAKSFAIREPLPFLLALFTEVITVPAIAKPLNPFAFVTLCDLPNPLLGVAHHPRHLAHTRKQLTGSSRLSSKSARRGSAALILPTLYRGSKRDADAALVYEHETTRVDPFRAHQSLGRPQDQRVPRTPEGFSAGQAPGASAAEDHWRIAFPSLSPGAPGAGVPQ